MQLTARGLSRVQQLHPSLKQEEAGCCHKGKAIPMLSCQPDSGEDRLPELAEPDSHLLCPPHTYNIPDNGVLLFIGIPPCYLPKSEGQNWEVGVLKERIMVGSVVRDSECDRKSLQQLQISAKEMGKKGPERGRNSDSALCLCLPWVPAGTAHILG